VNERIRSREVRLIDAEGKQVGVVPLEEALRHARVADLDLVEVDATATPPVCRILDYGKYQYEQDKKERELRKKRKKVEVKGVRISFKMGEHDRQLRRALAEKFLKEGHKVRVELPLRGREKALREVGKKALESFLESFQKIALVEEPVAGTPRGGLSATLASRG
jgi:translation initiation factor IF-3